MTTDWSCQPHQAEPLNCIARKPMESMSKLHGSRTLKSPKRQEEIRSNGGSLCMFQDPQFGFSLVLGKPCWPTCQPSIFLYLSCQSLGYLCPSSRLKAAMAISFGSPKVMD